MIYLAGPYSHDVPCIRDLRYKLLSQIAHSLLRDRDYVFSPITHGHAIERAYIDTKGPKPIDWSVWTVHGLEMLKKCEYIFVADLPGWQQSSGVKMEIDTAKFHKILVQHLEMPTIEKMTCPETLNDYLDLYKSHEERKKRV